MAEGARTATLPPALAALRGAQLERLGKFEYRDVQTTLLTCLAMWFRLCGTQVRLDHLLGSVPIPHGGAGARELRCAARRLGIGVAALDPRDLFDAAGRHMVLIRDATGFWFLLWRCGPDAWIVGVPGTGESFHQVLACPDMEQAGVSAFALFPPAPYNWERAVRPPRLQLLAWRAEYAGAHDPAQVMAMGELIQATPHALRHPIPHDVLTPAGLLATHATICAELGLFYGRYRSVTLRRGATVFPAPAALPELVSTLLRDARAFQASELAQAIDFAAALFADFLSLHPFFNANYRMVKLIVSQFLRPFGADIAWAQINASQHNYWMRCVQRGRFGVLRHAFDRHVVRIESTRS